MAEAFARKHAGDIIEPASCGVKPTDMVAPVTCQLMQEKGVDIGFCVPKGFDQAGTDYDVVVNMSGSKLPRGVKGQVAVWPVEDPYWLDDDKHRKIRDEIERRVVLFADELRAARRRAG
jgi:protein-tyrosine-phosphatase